MSDDELALFDLLFRRASARPTASGSGRQAGRSSRLRNLLRPMHDWTQKTATQAEVQMFILDNLGQSLPRPPFSDEETEERAARLRLRLAAERCRP